VQSISWQLTSQDSHVMACTAGHCYDIGTSLGISGRVVKPPQLAHPSPVIDVIVLSCDNCLEDEGSYQNCSVLYCVTQFVHSHKHTHIHFFLMCVQGSSISFFIFGPALAPDQFFCTILSDNHLQLVSFKLTYGTSPAV